jgi:excisionase family DNA binding protein
VKGLEDEQRPGRPRTVDRAEIIAATLTPPPVKLGITTQVVAAARRSLKCGRFDGAADLTVSPGIGPRRQIVLDSPVDRQHPRAPLRQWTARAHVAWEVNALEDRLLYRVTEVAVFLSVSRSKVYELLASGDLPSVKIDRTRLIRGSDLRDYVESLRPVA